VAVSDELGLTAQPVLTLERRRPAPGISRDDLRSLARLTRRFGVVGIVVGNPLHLSGEAGPQAAITQAFAAQLGELAGLPIHLWDERLTTQQAHQILYEAGTHARTTAASLIRWQRRLFCNRSWMKKQLSTPSPQLSTGAIIIGR